MLGIVGVVVDSSHGAQLVKALDEHPLGVHIAESERTLDVGHPFFAPPFLHCIEKHTAHFLIIDKIEPSEAHTFIAGALIHHLVDDAGDTPYRFPVVIDHEIYSLAKFKGGVFIGVQSAHLVENESRHIVLVVLIKGIDRELNKLL